MKVLILYATIEGQTGKIARFLEQEVAQAGSEAVVVDAVDASVPLDFEGVDRVILAAPVHERRHPARFEAVVAARSEELRARPVLLLSVSLNAAFPEGREEAEDYVVEMKLRTGLAPSDEMLVAGAVRTDHYDYYQTQVLRYVVMRGHHYDETAKSHEFTDWEALRAKVAGFLAA